MNKIFNLIKHPLFSGSAIMIVGSNLVSFLNYFYHLIMGRMLGPANYGELAALISLIGLLGIIPSSISLVVIKYISSADKQEVNNLINWLKKKVFLISFILFVAILLISPFITSFLKIPKMSYLIFIAIAFLFSFQSGLNRSILQGLLRFKDMVVSTLLEGGVRLIASIFLVYLGFQISGVMFALTISAVLGWYLTNNYLKQKSNREADPPPPNIKPMLVFTIPVIIQTIAITSLYSSDVILVKHFFSSHDAGIYAALSTLGKIIFFGSGPIASVMFPLVSQRHSRGAKYNKILIYSLAATVAVAIFISMFYYLFPTFAISLLYGSAYVNTASLLVWFGIFISLFTLSSLIVSFNLSLGKTRVVILPLLAALAQIIFIWIYHQSIFQVVLVSVITNALLLLTLLIYSIYSKKN